MGSFPLEISKRNAVKEIENTQIEQCASATKPAGILTGIGADEI